MIMILLFLSVNFCSFFVHFYIKIQSSWNLKELGSIKSNYISLNFKMKELSKYIKFSSKYLKYFKINFHDFNWIFKFNSWIL